MTLREVLQAPDNFPEMAWLYLPSTTTWCIESKCYVAISEEVPPEEENDPRAGYPEELKKMDVMQALPLATVQSIVNNARDQGIDGADNLLSAFLYYYDHDAFKVFAG